MKNFVFLILVFIVVSISLHSLSAQTPADTHHVTAVDYCNFLNSKAVTDTQNFYNEKTGSDPEAGSIIRTGSPGDYSYEVIAGRENFPITYVTKNATEQYCAWVEQQQAAEGLPAPVGVQLADDEFHGVDPWISSNQNSFYLIINSNKTSLDFHINNDTHSYIEAAVIGVTVVAALLGVREIVARCTSAPQDSMLLENQQVTFTPGNSLDEGIQGIPENKMWSTKEQRTINQFGEDVTLSRAGFFQAGSTLRNQLSNDVKETALEMFTHNTDREMNSLRTDLGRAHFVIQDNAKETEALYQEPSLRQKIFRLDMQEEAIQRFKKFTGSDHPMMAKAIARMMNQTLFANIYHAIHQDLTQPIFHSQELAPLGKIRLQMAINPASIEYHLKKEGEYRRFVLTGKYENTNPLADERFSMKQSHFVSYTFTANNDFTSRAELSLTNLPCNITCDDVQIYYEILENVAEEKS